MKHRLHAVVVNISPKNITLTAPGLGVFSFLPPLLLFLYACCHLCFRAGKCGCACPWLVIACPQTGSVAPHSCSRLEADWSSNSSYHTNQCVPARLEEFTVNAAPVLQLLDTCVRVPVPDLGQVSYTDFILLHSLCQFTL